MAKQFLRKMASLDLEEQILNLGAVVALIGVFLPWISGEWLGGETMTHIGIGYYTGYIGIAIACLHVFTLLITLIPLSGGPQLLQKNHKENIRFLACTQATILTLASLSVLTKTTLDFARLEIRFGIYLSLIGSLVASLYAYLRYQEQQKREVRELFHYPVNEPEDVEEDSYTAPRPTSNIAPPKQSEPEEHKVYASQLRR